MVNQSLAAVEEYRDTGFLVKSLYTGSRSDAILMHLKPGQEVPQHPHDRFEVVLLPQKGRAVLNLSDADAIQLTPGTIYYGESGQRFGIVNNGAENFQMVVLVHVQPDLDERETCACPASL